MNFIPLKVWKQFEWFDDFIDKYSPMPPKIIIDTDPWVDDALAIMYAIRSGCNIAGITTVFWNADLANTTRNALKILSIMWKSIPVFQGLAQPIKGENTFAKSHGIWGFGGYETHIDVSIESRDAVSYLIQELEDCQEKLNIICLWPTTNIARLAILRPELMKNIASVIILWWVVNEKWNITPYAEFNVYNDPYALKKVLSLGLETFLIPINVCRKVYFTWVDFLQIGNKDISSSIQQITKHYIDYYQNDTNYGEFAGGVMYDLLATTFFTNRELFTWKEAYIDVVVENVANYGETREDYSKKPNCTLITWVESVKLKDLFFETMNQ